MRKAINFDIDTKKFEEYTKIHSQNAYLELRKFLNRNGFEHRQGSGYISKDSLDDKKVTAIIIKMSVTFEWLKYCIKEMDVTNIGKQHSLVNTINKVIVNETVSDLEI